MSTLIEKLEATLKSLQETERGIYMTGFSDGYELALKDVKQHSDWISVDERLPTENDGRVSWGVNAYKKYILVNIVSRRVAMTCRFNLTDKCFETADKVTHWQPLPQPPSEVQP
ncbi:hypothetical protein ENHY17A_110271 [Moraxellaceae bacterium 17A]|nr:hypothetical protein ENHY17A_110271 [Moraxellaceae bacterium 17A]